LLYHPRQVRAAGKRREYTVRHGLIRESTGHDAEVDAGGGRFGYEGDKRRPKAFRVFRDLIVTEVETKVKRQVLKG